MHCTHGGHKSQLVLLQGKENTRPYEQLTLIRRISGHCSYLSRKCRSYGHRQQADPSHHETGESLTLAIQSALKARLERLKLKRPGHIMIAKLKDILHRVDSFPTLDTRPEAEILGYDDQGVPR
jgi:antitoxin VapB